jgi:hypothetical protein
LQLALVYTGMAQPILLGITEDAKTQTMCDLLRAMWVINGECPAKIPNPISTLTALSRFSGSCRNSGSKYCSALCLNSAPGIPSLCAILIRVLPVSWVSICTLTLPHWAELLNTRATCG